MRTVDEIKRKLHELQGIFGTLEYQITMMQEVSSGDQEDQEIVTVAYESLDILKGQIDILEWVLNEECSSET